MENEGWKKFRVLTLTLIFSGALNVGLILALVVSTLNQTKIPTQEKKLVIQEEAASGNAEILSEMLGKSFPELVVYLTNRDAVEEGYTKRDLALSSLIKAHFFNLEKALATPLSQKRVVSVSGKKIELYPGLTEDQYEAIIRFAYQEKWPLTTKGLFIALKNRLSQGLQDESLFSALMTTSEFHKVQVLFQKTGAEEDPKTLLSLLTDGSWEMLEKFSQEQSELLDLSLEKRRSFLMNYLAFRSKNAATLLLKTDLLFTKTRLSDPGILSILELLSDPSDLVKQFCIDLLHSPRSDAIREAAGLTLYRFSGEAPPVPFDSQVALERFSQASILEKPKPSTPTQKEKSSTSFRSKEHVVQEGETLWKISRQYKVKVDEIMRMNGLEKESLVPGMILRVPGQGTGSNPPR